MFLEIGLLLVMMPWLSFWERNYFAQWLPGLRDALANNYVRGAVSGLGVLNVYAGFSELAATFRARAAEPPPLADAQ